MILICPSCGAAHSAEGWENDAVARQTLQASNKLPNTVNQVVLAYMGLFRPAKQALRWKKSFKLINELAAMIAPGHVQIHGKAARPCPHHIWALGMEKMVDRRPQLDLPLKNHNYLIQVVYQLADQADAGREQLQRQSEVDGSARVHRMTPPEPPVVEELSQLERQYLARYGSLPGMEGDAPPGLDGLATAWKKRDASQ
jgi:hypothetical protein